jgi:hypothetical protein
VFEFLIDRLLLDLVEVKTLLLSIDDNGNEFMQSPCFDDFDVLLVGLRDEGEDLVDCLAILGFVGIEIDIEDVF